MESLSPPLTFTSPSSPPFHSLSQRMGHTNKDDTSAAEDDNNQDTDPQSLHTPHFKVVVRHLPPTLPANVFWNTVTEWLPETMYSHYVPGHVPKKSRTKPPVLGRAYLVFTDANLVQHFHDQFQGHVFMDSKGTKYPVSVSLALNPRIPNDYVPKQRHQAWINTLHKDKGFLSFVHQKQTSLTSSTTDSSSSSSSSSSIETKDLPAKPSNQETSHLLEYLKKKIKPSKSQSQTQSQAQMKSSSKPKVTSSSSSSSLSSSKNGKESPIKESKSSIEGKYLAPSLLGASLRPGSNYYKSSSSKPSSPSPSPIPPASYPSKPYSSSSSSSSFSSSFSSSSSKSSYPPPSPPRPYSSNRPSSKFDSRPSSASSSSSTLSSSKSSSRSSNKDYSKPPSKKEASSSLSSSSSSSSSSMSYLNRASKSSQKPLTAARSSQRNEPRDQGKKPSSFKSKFNEDLSMYM